MQKERLQKILARAGIASRRASEELIVTGKVRVNGRIVRELGTKVDPVHDKVEVNGKRVVSEKPAYYVLNKPRDVVSTLKDPEGRPTVADILHKISERVFPVGRLDYHTSGVLLFTNDGEWSDALLRPKALVEKVYVAKFQGHLDVRDLDHLRNGVVLDDGYKTKPAHVFVIREEPRVSWVQITLTEGKNRQIHRMGETIGHRVMRLSRTAFAGVSVEGLRPGQYRALTRKELERIKEKNVKSYREAKREAREGARPKVS